MALQRRGEVKKMYNETNKNKKTRGDGWRRLGVCDGRDRGEGSGEQGRFSQISTGLYPTLISPSVTDTQRPGLTQRCQSSSELLITEICEGQIS